VRRVGVGLCAGSDLLLPSVIGGKGVRRSWRWQLPRAWLYDPSGFGAASGAAFRHGSRKRFFRRRDSRCRPRTDLQLYGLLLVLASRVRKWARARDGNGYPKPEYPTGFTRYEGGYGMISLPAGMLMGKKLYPLGRRVRVWVGTTHTRLPVGKIYPHQ
jgi:hypothetical protein